MQSKTSFFSKTIFANQLKRFWPLYASFLVIWLLILPTSLLTMLRYAADHGYDATESAMNLLMNAGLYGGALMSIIFSALFAMAAFYYLYNNRSVSQMNCLPVTRTGTFLSVYLPGLLVMLVSNLVICLLSLAITSFYGVALAGYVFQAFAMMSLTTLFFYGFASFVAMLTGHVLVLPLVYGVLNFTVAGVVLLGYNILEKFVYGMALSSGEDSPLLLLSPIVYILGKTYAYPSYGADASAVVGFNYDGWGYLVAVAIAGIVFTGLAILLLKRRRMESAGDVVAINPLKPVFKYCMSFGCALIAGIGLYFFVFEERYYSNGAGFEDAIAVLIFMLIGAFIGYFASEMMLKKTLRVFGGKSWRGFAVVVLILVALTAVSEFDVLGFERKTPDVSRVESVTVYGFNGLNVVTDKDDIQAVIDIHKSIVSHKSQHETRNSYTYGPSFYVDYFMKDGSLFQRRYHLNTDVTEDIDAILDFLNSPEMILERATPDIDNLSAKNISEAYVSLYDAEYGYYDDMPLTSEEAYELYTQCILPDIKDGTLGFVDAGWIGESYSEGVEYMSCDISIYFFQRAANGDYFNEGGYSFKPTNKSLRTNAWLEEHGVEVKPFAEPVYYQ